MVLMQFWKIAPGAQPTSPLIGLPAMPPTLLVVVYCGPMPKPRVKPRPLMLLL